MNEAVPPSPKSGPFSDLLEASADGTPTLNDGVHPMPDLLTMDAETVLEAFKVSQQADFSKIISQLEDPENPLNRLLGELREIAEKEPGNRFNELDIFRPGALSELFLELHDHVMDHPVWRHPFFLRIF
ncbi:MAG: hypothetical protein ABW153_19530, partial [Sedimenticola sp.]